MNPFLVSINFLEKLKSTQKNTLSIHHKGYHKRHRWAAWWKIPRAGYGRKGVELPCLLWYITHTRHLQVYSYPEALWTSPFGFLRRLCYVGMIGNWWSTQHSALLPSLDLGGGVESPNILILPPSFCWPTLILKLTKEHPVTTSH